MTTEIFSRQQFEAALPKHRVTRKPLCDYKGFVKGEHTYSLPVKDGIEIIIRSSIDGSGYCADTREDSIRAWLRSSKHDRPLWKGGRDWITRQPGWEDRLTKLLRKLYWRGQQVATCNQCGDLAAVYTAKTQKNKGRQFYKCLGCQSWLGWLPEKQPKLL